jgi:hypothetical protein
MKIGDEVYHPKYGKGTIKLILPNPSGNRIKIDFGYAKPILLASEVRQSPGGSPLDAEVLLPPRPNLPGETITRLDPPTLLARQGIQALKLGQILDAHVERLSVGMDKLRKDFTQVLTQAATGQPTFLLITGAWGSGKSHALTMLETLARQRDFATSVAIMDGYSLSLARPMELLQEVMSNLIVPQQEGMDGIMAWLRAAISQSRLPLLQQRAPLIASVLRNLTLEALDAPEISQVVVDYLFLSMTLTQAYYCLHQLGLNTQILPNLRPYRLAERTVAFTKLLTNWAHFAKIMGAKGLLVILDELDVDYGNTARETQQHKKLREQRHNLLLALQQIGSAPLFLAFAAVPGLSFGHDSIRKDAIRHLQQVLQNRLTTLIVPELTENHYTELFSKLNDLYQQAYPGGGVQLSTAASDQLCASLLAHHRRDPQPLPRKFVRLCLEALDVLNTADTPSVETFLQAIY